MIKKLYLSVFISMFLATVAQASGTEDPYGNLHAILGDGSLPDYGMSTDSYSSGDEVYDPYGNLNALLGGGDYSDRAVSPE